MGLSDLAAPYRLLDPDAEEAIHAWPNLLESASFCMSLKPLDILQVKATADAMATPDRAVLGGAVFFSDGSVAWFQARIDIAETKNLWPWVSDSMQKHIASWELLAQFGSL